jgi:hypothetical protein
MWSRPLTPTEDRLVWQMINDVGSALQDDPALIAELLAALFSSAISGVLMRCDQDQVAEAADRLVDLILDRTDFLLADQAAEAIAEIPVAGHA